MSQNVKSPKCEMQSKARFHNLFNVQKQISENGEYHERKNHKMRNVITKCERSQIVKFYKMRNVLKCEMS